MNQPSTPADKIREGLSNAYWRGRRVGVLQASSIFVPVICVIAGASSSLLCSILLVFALLFWREMTQVREAPLSSWINADSQSTVSLTSLALLGYAVAQFYTGRWSW